MKRLLDHLLSIFYRTKWHLKPNHEVKLAFVHKGVEYYQMVGSPDMYISRYLAMLDIMDAMSYRIDDDYLNRLIELMKFYLNKGDLSETLRCVHNLEDRKRQLLNPELIYSLASVWFFDKNENVYEYNHEYAALKINRWRGDAELMQNFYMTPLGELMPLNNTLKENMQRYLLGATAEEIMTLENHLRRILKSNGSKELASSIQSRLEQLRQVV